MPTTCTHDTRAACALTLKRMERPGRTPTSLNCFDGVVSVPSPKGGIPNLREAQISSTLQQVFPSPSGLCRGRGGIIVASLFAAASMVATTAAISSAVPRSPVSGARARTAPSPGRGPVLRFERFFFSSVFQRKRLFFTTEKSFSTKKKMIPCF